MSGHILLGQHNCFDKVLPLKANIKIATGRQQGLFRLLPPPNKNLLISGLR